MQLRILALAAGMVAILLLATPVLRESLSAKPVSDIPHLVPGGFLPDDEQWKNITMGRVTRRAFPGLVDAEATVTANGDETTSVLSPFTGQVADIAVHAGDRVQKGAVLMTVSATEALQAQSDLIGAIGAAHTAQVTAHNADENEKRQHALYVDGSVALKDWQQAQADQAAGQAGLHAANAALIAARGKLRALGFADSQVRALESAAGHGGISSAAQVVAPVSGTVAQRLVGPGQFVQAGNPAFTIGNFERLWLTGNVREEDAPQVKVGQPVDVTVAALPGRVFKTRLSWVAPSIDPDTHRLAVRADVANPDGLLKPEMFASMLVHVGGDRVSPAIPEVAIIHEGDKAHVWVLSASGALLLRSIRPGRLQGGYAEVLAGLAPGEKLALDGSIFLDSTARAD